jgi:hypothetical protein
MNIYGGCCNDKNLEDKLSKASYVRVTLNLDDNKFHFHRDKYYGEYTYNEVIDNKNISSDLKKLNDEYNSKKQLIEDYKIKNKKLDEKIKDLERIIRLNLKELMFIKEKGPQLNITTKKQFQN